MHTIDEYEYALKFRTLDSALLMDGENPGIAVGYFFGGSKPVKGKLTFGKFSGDQVKFGSASSVPTSKGLQEYSGEGRCYPINLGAKIAGKTLVVRMLQPPVYATDQVTIMPKGR